MFDWTWLYAAGAGLLGVIATFLGAYRMGGKAERQKSTEAENKALRGARETRREIDNMDADDRRAELDSWMRDKHD